MHADALRLVGSERIELPAPNQRFRFTGGCDQPTVDLNPKKAGSAFQAAPGRSRQTPDFLCALAQPAHFAVSSACHASSLLSALHRGVPICIFMEQVRGFEPPCELIILLGRQAPSTTRRHLQYALRL